MNEWAQAVLYGVVDTFTPSGVLPITVETCCYIMLRLHIMVCDIDALAIQGDRSQSYLWCLCDISMFPVVLPYRRAKYKVGLGSVELLGNGVDDLFTTYHLPLLWLLLSVWIYTAIYHPSVCESTATKGNRLFYHTHA